MTTLKVPLLSLLPPSAIKIKELKLSFKVGLGKIKIDPSDNKNGPSRTSIWAAVAVFSVRNRPRLKLTSPLRQEILRNLF
ncbi:DUF2589 domain-containing protein [Flavobacterium lindanitolerans]|nr:DUF2589 domain-containing protein [Flavobacterium lindanitolerans]